MFLLQMWTLLFIPKAEGDITIVSQKWAYYSWACDRLVVLISPEHWLEHLGSYPQFTWSCPASANSMSPKIANTLFYPGAGEMLSGELFC